jgi:hypothetical protein
MKRLIAILICAASLAQAQTPQMFRDWQAVAGSRAVVSGGETLPQPVYWWKMTEADTVTVADWVGANVGTINSAVLTNMSPYCFYFGGSAYIQLITNTVITGTNNFTWTAWVKTAQNTGGAPQPVLLEDSGNGDGTANACKSGVLFWQGDGYGFNRDDAGADASTGLNLVNGRVSDNTWHFICVVRDGTNVLRYIDGVFVVLRNIGTVSITTVGSPPPRIGRPATDHFSKTYYIGYIDDVRLYAVGLSSNEQYQVFGESRQ